jgi:hypothetical protein
MRLILSLLLAASSPALAAETHPLKLKDGRTALLSLVEEGETARLRLETEGNPPVTSEILGEEFQEFTIDGKPTLLATQDLDADGSPEIFVRTTLPPRSGQFFAFRMEAGQLVPLKFNGAALLEVSHGGDVILRQGKVEYEEYRHGARPLRRTVRFDGQAFTPLLR